jgi:hypothetical protein
MDPLQFSPALMEQMERLRFKGEFQAVVREASGLLVSRTPIIFPNAATNQGLNDILNVYFAGSTATAAWFFGLIDNAGYTTGIQPTDTPSGHGGWAENTAYTQANRQQWVPGTVAGQSVTNPVVAQVTMNASVTIKGAFIISNNTKGGTTGTLWATGLFGTPQALVNTQILQLTYTCSASGS